MRYFILHSRGARVGSLTALLGVLLISTGWALLVGGAVRAQEKPVVKADAAAIVVDLDDIERMRVINPLKLQPDQTDKLIAALTSAQADYEKKINALGMAVLGGAGAEVRDVKRKALVGGAIPRDFDDKIKKLQADFLKQRDDLNIENIKRVAGACRDAFTAKQVAVATKLERDAYEKEHTDGKTVTDVQLFNLYCVDVFISNPRALPLLKEIRAAAK